MRDHLAPRLSRLPSMDSQRRLPRSWVCGSLELTALSTKLILDLDFPVERVRLPLFAPLFPMDHAFCQTRSRGFSLFPAFTFSSRCPDSRSKERASHFSVRLLVSR